MRAQEFIFERETVPFQGIDMSLEVEKDDDYVDDDDADNQLIHVRAMSGGRELGHVLFTQDYDSQGLVLNPQDLEVDERYRGQGIAAAMYDYVKSQGYRIRRSGQQTDAGAGFWAKHRPDSNVWEQGVTDGSVTKKPQPYNDPNWAKKLPKEKLNALAGPRYKKDKKEQGVSEVKILSKVKGKGSQPSMMPKRGLAIRPDEETRYLGQQVGKIAGYPLYRDYLGGQVSYQLFDPESRTVIVVAFGSRYKGNPQSLIVSGLYAAPGNPVRAAKFYRGLILDQGLTLISDRNQSPGGQRVWQQLESYPDIEVYGYDTGTGEVQNFGAKDTEMYAVPSQGVNGSRDMQRVARDLRLVATARSQR